MSAVMMTPTLGLAGSSLTGRRVQAKKTSAVAKVNTTISASGKKGINKAVKGGAPNTGVSKEMNKKGWVDASGRKGKGQGVYKFDSKYGANVDGYSPIWSPNEWSQSGDSYKPGKGGLVLWAGLLVVGLGFAGYLILSTSAL
mmetsp:Transcript_4331/g.4999  ORF Transcript_4331/g.4999 Transcript_4331/m.4999 type:complete len:142 (-) Transcript_4331:71-496(-)|eukprot:CAMPEP_0197843904 /NCGR_PEP_ID=MMETSP1438-20131217/883_1 /TAXON_ID=1461541 /ORGANISM="Pterosperma sp., Strain CCMP1384" /LENGTH=141 /DNA_ID=CAMNT_0043454377 /DNA_START=78 /DNA_END=503 /DNA_ORIENTATION=+